ncbi:acyl-CoA N-acyltransferase [Mytilinidion resinicola]|uniref:Acyl-CoA N-acyltransferase n=1 Tax=Mytilinidion resinicola TaxID=574789 RepID=A0A6A6Z542_9PEZI|nr:acyl-CoA N-acyltransferase [Mytilinidion resinicola]KAF2815948.1 acyl-CoA N-acyltransferase [Mytilinidion resinicola]
MPLELAPLTADDVDAYMAIRQAAFGDSVFRILFSRRPDGPSPEVYAQIRDSVRDQIATDKHVFFLKVTDTDTSEIIAGAKWKVFRTEKEVLEELELPSPTPDSDPECWNAFMKLLSDAKRERMALSPYWMLDALSTHPAHHRRGAGAMLIRWGLVRADEEGVETYLEASAMGQPLYERYGFRPVRTLRFDFGEFGGEGVQEFQV